MSDCRLSIVTVTMNCLEDLKKTVASVASQRLPSLDYVIFDGNSTDGTREYALSKPFPVTTAHSGDDDGIYDAMNQAVRLCVGDYVQFLNAADTFVDADALSAALALMPVDADVVVFGYRMGERSYQPDLSLPALTRGMPCHQAILYRRSYLLQHPYDPRLRLCADYAHLLKSLSSAKVVGVPHILVDYDCTGITAQPRRQRQISLERARAAFKSDLGLHVRMPIAAYNLLRAATQF